MRVSVGYASEALELEVDEDKLVGAWSGPTGRPAPSLRGHVFDVLEQPLNFPPLRQAVVPGDRVVIPVGADVPALDMVLSALCEVLLHAGIEPGAITVVNPEEPAFELPDGCLWARHDPSDRSALAYLANTTGGRRVYLNRLLTDADVVVPIGRIGRDIEFDHQGPWGSIYPGASDLEARQTVRSRSISGQAALEEAAEVCWLLGSLFQIAVAPGVAEPIGVLAGHEAAVRAEAASWSQGSWTYQAPDQADLVVVGIGVPWRATRLDDLALGLEAASRLVRNGGKIVALSHAEGKAGRSLEKLAQRSDDRIGPGFFKHLENEPDYPVARLLTDALRRADIYLLSQLSSELVESLGMVPISSTTEVSRLVGRTASCLFLSPGEQVYVEPPNAG